ncbi:MAG TPA: B12-binding domain-containing radical SAM protein, partial [Bacillota bacterium]|nr:B12-binding domain-containing radical SAM protein [Bacillota bacterium]
MVNWEIIEKNLNKVTKPGRYIGNEYNVQIKEWDSVELKVALAFPDLYEIGMSHLGLRILYELINSQPGMLAERVYSPWLDFQELLRNLGQPLYALESKRSLHEFDVVGFSLQYEMSYTNILTILDLAGIPLLAADRSETDPLIIGGGPCAFNPEPLTDFFDFFFLGEAEEALTGVLDQIRQLRNAGCSKTELLTVLQQIPGVYVPTLFDISYRPDGKIER